MSSLIRYNLFLFVLFTILLYFAVSWVQLFGAYTQLFNIFTIIVLLVLGIYYPRFSKGISERMVRKTKIIWTAGFLVVLAGVMAGSSVISDGIFYLLFIITGVFLVMNLKK
ncbi:hypothetical protein AS034_02775 [[Bacillus] enclensis]|uniref:Uncharacterized protein n=1 Tax=[Bacillus] enclensis TaxID=1402860 RepID=A0A0V8HKU4_9BACI|nr:hypothetical protein [[Bacillus] enclensis]KSU63196.1 hypothetical protein AS034_02775 [[Bacillus] enclensis]SCB79984.1 hypothetical protein GA0061094_0576 [[Bacillus] enclensis]